MNSTWKRFTNWELWPFMVIYAPLGFLWIYYAVRARAFWFFSNVNPTIEFSGFEGEAKKEMYDQLPQSLYPKTVYIKAKCNFEKIKEDLRNVGLTYPFAAKPEVGMQGIMFRKISNEQELLKYHQIIPVDYLLQELVDMPYEFSVFHIRYPEQTKGIVTGFILKEYMAVVGDGTSTLLQLIQKHPKGKFREVELRRRHAENLNIVLPCDEKYYLSITGNHNRGAKFVNLYKEIDQQLCDVFDKISNEAGDFYFGRYDLKCTSVADLKAGENISILEYNGTGAEPNHIYDCGMTYTQALNEIARHWKYLYEISEINRRRGIPHWSFLKGYKYWRHATKLFKELRKYDEMC